MKHFCKLVTAALLAALMLFAVAGCSSSQAVAKVGDRTITLQSYKNTFSTYQSYNGYYFSYDLDTEEGLADYQDYILDLLITREMYIYQAGQLGITLTDEEIAECEQEAEEDYQETYDYYYSAGESAGSSDPNAYANSQMSSMLSKQGLTVSSYKKQLLEDAKNTKLISKVEAQLEAEGTPTADALRADYEEELANQKTLFDETPSEYFNYETYWSYYENYGYDFGYCMPLYVPDGFFYVRHILVEDEATAKTLYESIMNGADFDEVLAENNTDSAEPDEGYMVGEGANYVTGFLEAALALEMTVMSPSPSRVIMAGTSSSASARLRPTRLPMRTCRSPLTPISPTRPLTPMWMTP